MQDKFPMTKSGEKLLQDELNYLKTTKRPQIIDSIAEARAHGDLKENAEYHAAREEQGLTEARIKDLEYKLGKAQVIDISSIPNSGKVVFGVTVELEDINTEKTLKYQIVGQDEADIKKGKLAYNTPIAKALIGNEEGDVVDVEVPGGIKTYEITAVIYE